MDYLIDQAVSDKYNITALPYNTINKCTECKHQVWSKSTLETIYNENNMYKVTRGNKVLQICKNFRCVNPAHLREVTYENWFKNGLEVELLWMDFV